MQCPNCGHHNKKDAEYCSKCGTKLPLKSEQEDQSSSSHHKIIIIILVLLIIGLIFAIVYVVGSNIHSKNGTAYKSEMVQKSTTK